MAEFAGPTDGPVVKIVGDDWRDLPDLIEALTHTEVVVELPNGDRIKFKAERERLSWADGFRVGCRLGFGSERILRAMDAALQVVEAADEDNREEAALLYARLDGELTEVERWRKNQITERFASWHRGSNTKSSIAASGSP